MLAEPDPMECLPFIVVSEVVGMEAVVDGETEAAGEEQQIFE